jgi:hypothetical protein
MPTLNMPDRRRETERPARHEGHERWKLISPGELKKIRN